LIILYSLNSIYLTAAITIETYLLFEFRHFAIPEAWHLIYLIFVVSPLKIIGEFRFKVFSAARWMFDWAKLSSVSLPEMLNGNRILSTLILFCIRQLTRTIIVFFLFVWVTSAVLKTINGIRLWGRNIFNTTARLMIRAHFHIFNQAIILCCFCKRYQCKYIFHFY
jgi:hypothetical protein